MRIVHSKKALAGAAALLLLLPGCSDPQGTEPGEPGAAASEAPGDDAASGDEGKSGSTKTGSGSAKGGGGSGAGGGKAGGGSGGGGTRGPGGGKGFAGGSGGSGGSGDYMAAGEYVYDQEGYERFCNGPSCNKEPLPDTATITASYQGRSADAVTIVTESRSSDSQTATTTTRHTKDAALITRVEIDFAYGAFNYSQIYEPRPPVVSLSFPLEVGKSWKGRWKAQTSGDYHMKVTGFSDGIYRIETVTNFKGDFSGRAQATVWVDGGTRAVVRTDGQIAVASGFGEYTSDFRTTLRSAPSS